MPGTKQGTVLQIGVPKDFVEQGERIEMRLERWKGVTQYEVGAHGS